MKNLLAILQIIPALIAVVRAVENAIPESGKGKDKLAMVRQMLEVSYAGIAELWPALEKVIGVMVSTFNQLKVFSK